MANNPEQLFGDYAALVNKTATKTPLEGLRDVADNVIFKPGCQDNKCVKHNSTAVKLAASQADAVVVCLGTGTKHFLAFQAKHRQTFLAENAGEYC